LGLDDGKLLDIAWFHLMGLTHAKATKPLRLIGDGMVISVMCVIKSENNQVTPGPSRACWLSGIRRPAGAGPLCSTIRHGPRQANIDRDRQ
jgi:hypothetical protein